MGSPPSKRRRRSSWPSLDGNEFPIYSPEWIEIVEIHFKQIPLVKSDVASHLLDLEEAHLIEMLKEKTIKLKAGYTRFRDDSGSWGIETDSLLEFMRSRKDAEGIETKESLFNRIAKMPRIYK